MPEAAAAKSKLRQEIAQPHSPIALNGKTPGFKHGIGIRPLQEHNVPSNSSLKSSHELDNLVDMHQA